MLDQLLSLVSGPPDPVEAGTRQGWVNVEQVLGIVLPLDYMDFINTFGSGQVGGFIAVLNPFSHDDTLSLVSEGFSRLDALRFLKARHGESECPYPLYPEEGGLLPWGITDNGDVLFWQTLGDPDEWSIVVNEGRRPIFEEFACSVTTFLVRVLNREIASKILTDAFTSEDNLFYPISS
jgi:hypothetical protein